MNVAQITCSHHVVCCQDPHLQNIIMEPVVISVSDLLGQKILLPEGRKDEAQTI